MVSGAAAFTVEWLDFMAGWVASVVVRWASAAVVFVEPLLTEEVSTADLGFTAVFDSDVDSALPQV